MHEIKCTVSSYESAVLERNCEAEVVNDVADTTHSLKAVQVSEGTDLEGRTAPSAADESLSAAQKHSVTVTVIIFLVFTSFIFLSFCFFLILSYSQNIF